MAGKEKAKKNGNAVLGFETKLWFAADTLPANLESSSARNPELLPCLSSWT